MTAQERIHDEKEELAEGTLISHLVELRQRLFRAIIAIVVIFVVLLPFQQQIFDFVADPLVAALPDGSLPISTGPIAPFMVPLKTTLFVALFAAMPVVLYQVWQFVAPGLYRKEKRFAIPLVCSSIILFYVGVAFAYFVVFDLIFSFVIAQSPDNVQVATDIGEYLSFVLRMFLAFGLAFEVPIATFMLVWSRLVSVRTLGKARPYVFLGAFVIGMFLTPPDAISQTLLAIPIYILYESGLILARVLLRDRLKDDKPEPDADAGESSS